MQINPNNSNISFKSRSRLIKDADYLRRTVNREFPVVAYTKAAHEAAEKIPQIKKIMDFLKQKTRVLNSYREDRHFVKSPFTFYKNILYSTTKEKLGTCFEQSSLIELALRLNGVKNCGKASLADTAGNLLNHSVAYVKTGNDPKKTVIIDTWLQDCGFLPEMMSKYKNEYKRYFKNPAKGQEMVLITRKPQELTPEQTEYFKQKYPQLVLKNRLFADR